MRWIAMATIYVGVYRIDGSVDWVLVRPRPLVLALREMFQFLFPSTTSHAHVYAFALNNLFKIETSSTKCVWLKNLHTKDEA